jgi:hypothetical protein
MSQTATPAIEFAAFIAERANDFTGRQWVFCTIDTWLAKPNPSRYFLLTGEPGGGKTAIAAQLAQFSAGHVVSPPGSQQLAPGFLRAVHFCRATASDWIDPRTFARSISLQLAAIPEFARALKDVGDKEINIDVEVQVGTAQAGSSVTGIHIENLVIRGLNGQEAFNRTVLDPLRTIYNQGYHQPILILVDALDEALASSTEVTIVDLLAGVQGLHEQVRFILTSRTEPRVENKFLFDASGMSLSDPAHTSENSQDITAYMVDRIQHDDKLGSQVAALSPVQVAALRDLIVAKAEGNFQYVAFLLKAIAEGQQSLDNLAGLPSGLDGLYYSSLDRLVKLGKKDWGMAYKPLLGVLSVAQEPLTLAQLQTYSGLPGDAWEVLVDLRQFVETTPESWLSASQEEPEDCYRLYHQSVVDFLRRRQLVVAVDGQKKTLDNIYRVLPDDWHKQIVAHYAGTNGGWAQKNWSQVAPYGLRYLVAHLFELRNVGDHRSQLHTLLQTKGFIDQRLQRLANPNPVLDDLRVALAVALEDDSLVHAWQHLREYRRVLREQLDFQRMQTAVQNGDYTAAVERTTLYGYLPNSQALARLWIAWAAAASAHPQEALAIVQQALLRLAPRGMVQAVRDAVGEMLQRLLVRLAKSTALTLKAQEDWLRQAGSPWPGDVAQQIIGRLPQPLDSWGDIFDAHLQQQSMPALLEDLKRRRIDADAADPRDISYRDAVFYFQRQLAAGLFNSRYDPLWLAYVQQTVTLAALDDYPSYREMALAWVAAAILAHEDESTARSALAIVLGSMFKPSPGFWGDTVAATMNGIAHESSTALDPDTLLSRLEQLEVTSERGLDLAVPRTFDDVIQWRQKVGLPVDPWSFGLRRRSAVAAVMYRSGDLPRAEALLQAACAAGYKGSYAGFRALARLSLACRWLEWRRIPEAFGQIEAARLDAANVRDQVLREERLELVGKMRDWMTQHGPALASLTEQEALAQVQQKGGMERGLYIEFLAALWCDDIARLKRLLLLALDDTTTTDAVLGRLLGGEAHELRPDRPFAQLLKVFEISVGLDSE